MTRSGSTEAGLTFQTPNRKRDMMMKHLTITLLICWAVFVAAADVVAQLPTFANVPYVSGGGERQQLDIYLPQNYREIEKLPVIVWIHGGGWQNGSKNDMPGKALINQGYACVSINYRLSQHAVFPAQIEDCKAAIRWLRANAKKYHLDPERIGVWGASAGGHLVALLGTTNHKKDFDVGENLDQSSAVQAVCDIFGPTGFASFTHVPNYPDNPVEKLLGGPLAEKKELAALASPMTHVAKENPPFLILHGTDDRVVPLVQSTQFHEALKKAGVDAEISIAEGAGHNRAAFTTPEYMRTISKFFDKHLKNEQ